MKISQLILLIAIVGCLDAKSLINPPSQTNGTCRKLVDSMAEEKGLYCAGLVRDKVLIITKDDTVFEIPHSNLDMAGRKWNLQGVKGIPLKDKWPSLHNHPRYAAARRASFQCFTFIDAKAAYIVIETKEKDNVKGIIYDLDRAEVTQQTISWKGHEDVVLLPTNIPLTYYQAHGNHVDGSFQIATFKANSPSILDQKLAISQQSEYSNLCKVNGSTNKLVVKSASEECDSLKWHAAMGFVSDKLFYFFNGSSIFMFSEKLYTNPGSEHDAYVMGPDSLINCGGTVAISEKPTVEKHNWI